MIKQYLTIKQAADSLGVSRQRMHALIKTYGLKTEAVNARLLLVSRGELRKIPKSRPSGFRKKAKNQRKAIDT